MKTVILNPVNIERILRRIAYQVVESSDSAKEVTLVGMMPRGSWVADQLTANLNAISKLKIKRLDVDVDKLESLESERGNLEGKEVILVDDIINSGSSMMRVAGALISFNPNSLITACLVDRKHRKYPIKCDFAGLSLATTLQEHLKLEIEPEPTIYLR